MVLALSKFYGPRYDSQCLITANKFTFSLCLDSRAAINKDRNFRHEILTPIINKLQTDSGFQNGQLGANMRTSDELNNNEILIKEITRLKVLKTPFFSDVTL